MKIPKLPRSVVTHYAAVAKSEQVAIEIKVDGVSFRITPFEAKEEASAPVRNGAIESPLGDGLKPW